jgi:hypothetical protein
MLHYTFTDGDFGIYSADFVQNTHAKYPIFSFLNLEFRHSDVKIALFN